MTDDLSKYNDYQLQMMLLNTEQDGKHAKAMVQAGNEAYRPKHAALQAKWKAVKAEMKRRANPEPGLAAAAPATAAAPLTAKEFHRMCAGHDWNYEYSDDPGSYRAGRANADRMEGIVRNQPEFSPILKAWKEHIAAGGPRPQEPA